MWNRSIDYVTRFKIVGAPILLRLTGKSALFVGHAPSCGCDVCRARTRGGEALRRDVELQLGTRGSQRQGGFLDATKCFSTKRGSHSPIYRPSHMYHYRVRSLNLSWSPAVSGCFFVQPVVLRYPKKNSSGREEESD